MNIKKIIGFGTPAIFFFGQAGHRVIATFGSARLVRKADGRHELMGGTAADCAEAREWCSLFAPAVVFSSTARWHRIITLTA